MNIETKVEKHYGAGGIMQKIEAALISAGKDIRSLTVDDLGPIDEFHTRGRASTLEVAALTSLQASDLVLDVGCGTGILARELAEHFESVRGVDPSLPMLEIARNRRKASNIEYELVDIDALEPNGTYDLVASHTAR